MPDQHSLTRRRLITTAAGSLALTALPGLASANSPLPAPGVATSGTLMRDRAVRLLALFNETQRDRARFAFNSSTRQRWNFMGPWAKPGLPLEAMTSQQQEAAMDLLATALSPRGMTKAQEVMVLQDVLRELGDGPADRSQKRFSVAIFGEPSPREPWGWRFEGHHLSLSFTLAGERVVSVTPSSFSSNPNVVTSGRYRGTVALEEEVTLARQLYNDLQGRQREAALIRERAFGNILTTAGREGRFDGRREGVPLADLTQAQADLAQRLVAVYGVDHLSAPLAEEQQARLAEGDAAALHFGWAGSAQEGEMMYYRLHGDTFLIEFASLPRQPLHLHTVRHDLERNLGAHAV